MYHVVPRALVELNYIIQENSKKFHSGTTEGEYCFMSNPVHSFKLYDDGCYTLQYSDGGNVFYTKQHKTLPQIELYRHERINYSPKYQLIYVSSDKDCIWTDISEIFDIKGNLINNDAGWVGNFMLEYHEWEPTLSKMRQDSEIYKKTKDVFPLADVQHFGKFVAILKENMFFVYDLSNQLTLFPMSPITKICSDINNQSNKPAFEKYYLNQYLDILDTIGLHSFSCKQRKR